MSEGSNPFQGDSQAGKADLSDILECIKVLKHRPNPTSDIDNNSGDPSTSRHFISHTEPLKQLKRKDEQLSPGRTSNSILQQKPRKVHIKNNRDVIYKSNDEDQLLPSNRKITEFFDKDLSNNKSFSSMEPEPKAEESQSSNYISRLQKQQEMLRQEINEIQIESIQEENELSKTRQASLEIKNQQQRVIKEFLTDLYEKKLLYLEHVSQVRIICFDQTQLSISGINQQIEELKRKSKESKKRKKVALSSNDEDNHCLPEEEEKDNRSYSNAWIVKLEKDKDKLLQFNVSHPEIEPIPIEISQQLQKTILIKYHPLCVIRNCNLLAEELLCMELEALKEEVLTLIRYPSFIAEELKKSVFAYLQELHRSSMKLTKNIHDGVRFIRNTVVSHLSEQKLYICIGREYNEKHSSLSRVLQVYETLPEQIVKNIVRSCIKALDEARYKTGNDYFLLPSNIYFGPKCTSAHIEDEIKLTNLAYNPLFLRQEFHSNFIKSGQYYYVKPFEGETGMLSQWSIGILLYELTFAKKPFSYAINEQVNRNEFYLRNEIDFPMKPVCSDKFKELFKLCVSYSRESVQLRDLLTHAFFNSK